MIINKTEYGVLETTVSSNTYSIFLKSYDNAKSVKVGQIIAPSNDHNSASTMHVCLSKYGDVLLKILRFESKHDMFLSIPTSNPFSDAMLRVQIESTGQTLAVREFIDNDDIETFTWTTYPKECEQFNIDAYLSNSLVVLTPYGLYRVQQIDTQSANVLKIVNNTEKVLGLVQIPYAEDSILITNAIHMQALEVILTDTNDIVWKKTLESTKRTDESIKYMFNYDKLRRAMRSKGVK